MHVSIRTVSIAALIVGLILALLVTAFREEPVAVDLATVERGSLVITVDAEGETRVRELYTVSAPISGTLLRLPLSVGDPVVAGETVVAQVQPASAPLLDSRSRAQAEASLLEADAQVLFAEAEVARTLAEVRYSISQSERAEALVARGAASLTRLEDAGMQVELAQSGAASAEARLAMARASQERARAALDDPGEATGVFACCVQLFAPSDGMVLSQSDVSARPVVAGETLLSIGDPAALEVVVNLLSADATRLQEGALATLERWGGDGVLEARLRRIEPTARTVVSALGIEEQRVDALLDITTSGPGQAGLGHGFSVYARIEEWRTDDALLVPLSAAFRDGAQWYVFQALEGIAIKQPVELGRHDGRLAVVKEGLGSGAQVITHPPDTLVEGSAISERVRF
ncbi:MAG: HlyD family efflux transporter periplasmic adaptor subunit [Pseudomonadota bacterium]